MTQVSMPAFPVDDPAERVRFFHHLEYLAGWEYTTTRVHEKDLPPRASTEQYPGGWDYKATRPDGFHLNSDKGVGYDEAQAGWTKVAPGVLRNPNWFGDGGPRLIAYWRRKK